MKNQLAAAVQLTPILARVHGANHPELVKVCDLTAQLAQSPTTESSTQLFDQLRPITKNYAVPADGCEAYGAAYASLKAADTAHHKN